MKEDELYILQLLLQYPEDGLRAAINRYGKTVHWIVRNILGRDAEVEECVSEIFVRLWQSAARFDENRGVSLASWLYGIARHTALDYRRKTQHQANHLPIEELDLQLDLNLDDMLAREQNASVLRHVVDGLPPPDREIFVYRYFLELSTKEIAARLNLSVKQVENKLYRGRQKLRRQLIEKGVVR